MDRCFLLTDNLNSYTWDAFGSMVTVTSGSSLVTNTYDAFGRLVENNPGGTYTEFLWGPTGAKLASVNGTTLLNAFIALPGGASAVYTASGLMYYRHSDWLGSSRLTSTATKPTALYFSTAYAPFGEQYATSGTYKPWDASFTGQDQSTVSDLYDFWARRQSPSQGRWVAPDPAGTAAVDPTSPQSWNRYAYVLNNPLSLVDPLGLTDSSCDPSTDWCYAATDDGGGGGGSIPGFCSAQYSFDECGGMKGFMSGNFGDSVGAFNREYAGVPPSLIAALMAWDAAVAATIAEANAEANGDPCSSDSGSTGGSGSAPAFARAGFGMFGAGSIHAMGAGQSSGSSSNNPSNSCSNNTAQQQLQQKQQQCAGIYNNYLQAAHNQAWSNVRLAAAGALGGCVAAGLKGCLTGAIIGAASVDFTLSETNWGMDTINIQYAMQLQNAGCSGVSF